MNGSQCFVSAGLQVWGFYFYSLFFLFCPFRPWTFYSSLASPFYPSSSSSSSPSPLSPPSLIHSGPLSPLCSVTTKRYKQLLINNSIIKPVCVCIWFVLKWQWGWMNIISALSGYNRGDGDETHRNWREAAPDQLLIPLWRCLADCGEWPMPVWCVYVSLYL